MEDPGRISTLRVRPVRIADTGALRELVRTFAKKDMGIVTF